MKLYAISDLHLANKLNFQALEALPAHLDDWLILAGDNGELEEHLKVAIFLLKRRFKRLIWVPGNHDLWTLPSQANPIRGEARYHNLVDICRQNDVLTPEDPFETILVAGQQYLVAPMFLLYDYSFRPIHIPAEKAVDWAAESGVVCTDEELLFPDPYLSRAKWCEQRCNYTEDRLKQEATRNLPMILINHFPLRSEMAQLYQFPRFSLWCGTQRTEDWHIRFPVSVVVYGHMHIRSTRFQDGVRFEEVSLGYPRDWVQQRGLKHYLREILPGPTAPSF